VCLPWDSGGLDLKSTRSINASLLLHLSWNLFTQESQCSSLFQHQFLSFGLPRSRYFKSSVWPGVREYVSMVSENSIWIIGNGEKINLWLDNLMGVTLVSVLNTPTHLFPHLTAKLQIIITNGRWQLLPSILKYPLVADSIVKITLLVTPLTDRRAWLYSPGGNLSAKLAFQFLHPPPASLGWASIIWRPCIPPSHSFGFWHLMLSKLPTDENLQKRGCTLVSICGLCYKHAESSSHLFLLCDFAVAVWRSLGLKLNHSLHLSSVLSLISNIPVRCSSQMKDVMVAAIIHAVYCIWLSRNAMRFSSVSASLHDTMAKITSFVAMSGMNSNGYCLPFEVAVLNNFLVHPTFRRVKDIVPVVWKTPTINWVKANTDGSNANLNASCGGIFRDFRGTFLGCFASNIGSGSVFEA